MKDKKLVILSNGHMGIVSGVLKVTQAHWFDWKGS